MFGRSLCFIFHFVPGDLWGMIIDPMGPMGPMGHGQDEPFPSRKNQQSQSDRQYLGKKMEKVTPNERAPCGPVIAWL